jgi:Ca2+-binding EF-hand superfamily protein
MGSFKALDANNDGSISRDEAKSSDALSRRFNELDLNRDGKLSESELNAAGSPAAGGSRPGSMGTAPAVPK